MTKISIIGAGQVGSTTAYCIAQQQLADEIVMIDLLAEPTAGKALDILESTGVSGGLVNVTGGADYTLAQESDIIVITAGVPRKKEEKREDTLATNARIMRDVINKVKETAPNAVLVIVTNPLDAMTWLAATESSFPKEKVIGMAGTLDTARYKTFLSQASNVATDKIEAVVLGGHGDFMVPLTRLATINDKAASEALDEKTLQQIEERTRNGGAEIVNLLGTGSAYYATAAAITQVLDALVNERKEAVPVSAWIDDAYGLKNVYLGVPCKLCKEGVKEIVELELDDDEKKALHKSATSVRKLLKELKALPVEEETKSS